MAHSVWEFLKDIGLILGYDALKEYIRKSGAEMVGNGINKARRRLKEVGEWWHELRGYLNSMDDQDAAQAIFSYLKRVELGHHKTYPNADHSQNEKYAAGYMAMVEMVLTDHYRFLSGDESTEDKEGATIRKRRDLSDDELEMRRKSFETFGHLPDEDKDAWILVMANNLPNHLAKKTLEILKTGASVVDKTAKGVASVIDPVNATCEKALNEFRVTVLGLKPMFDGTPTPGQTDFKTRLKQAWKGNRP
jgi:hypothetical protein